MMNVSNLAEVLVAFGILKYILNRWSTVNSKNIDSLSELNKNKGFIVNSDTSQSADLVKVMRQIPFPVTIVTAASKGEIRGITIGSFTSLSLKPPLVSFNVEKRASMHELISSVDKFAIHIPGADQAHLCNRFATPDLSGDEQFRDIDYKTDPEGVPLLRNVPAIIQCRKFDQIETGDHSIIVGEVLSVIRNKNEPAILYLSGSYRSLDFK